MRVKGVKSGDTVKVYSDASCAQEVGSMVATGSTADVLLNTLTPGTYSFHAVARSATGANSSCVGSAAYVLSACPTGFIPVPYDTSVMTFSDFCVMKYEAKAWTDANSNSVAEESELNATGCGACGTANWGLTNLPASVPEALPWRRISQANARLRCQALNTGGAKKFDLISNPEWMTLARNIESTDASWSGGTVGSGCIFRGNAGEETACSYDGADPEGGTGRNVKARHTLSNGEQIWDLSGNINEWINWTITYDAITSPPSGCGVSGDHEAMAPTCASLLEFQYKPLNPLGIATSSYTSANYGLGLILQGTATPVLRGGSYSWSSFRAGIYNLHMSTIGTTEAVDRGFRCVFRP